MAAQLANSIEKQKQLTEALEAAKRKLAISDEYGKSLPSYVKENEEMQDKMIEMEAEMRRSEAEMISREREMEDEMRSSEAEMISREREMRERETEMEAEMRDREDEMREREAEMEAEMRRSEAEMREREAEMEAEMKNLSMTKENLQGSTGSSPSVSLRRGELVPRLNQSLAETKEELAYGQETGSIVGIEHLKKKREIISEEKQSIQKESVELREENQDLENQDENQESVELREENLNSGQAYMEQENQLESLKDALRIIEAERKDWHEKYHAVTHEQQDIGHVNELQEERHREIQQKLESLTSWLEEERAQRIGWEEKYLTVMNGDGNQDLENQDENQDASIRTQQAILRSESLGSLQSDDTTSSEYRFRKSNRLRELGVHVSGGKRRSGSDRLRGPEGERSLGMERGKIGAELIRIRQFGLSKPNSENLRSRSGSRSRSAKQAAMKWAETSNVDLQLQDSGGLSIREEADGMTVFRKLEQEGSGIDIRTLMGSMVGSSNGLINKAEWLKYLSGKKKTAGQEKFQAFLRYILAKCENL